MLPRLSQTLQLLTDLCGGVFADTEAATFAVSWLLHMHLCTTLLLRRSTCRRSFPRRSALVASLPLALPATTSTPPRVMAVQHTQATRDGERRRERECGPEGCRRGAVGFMGRRGAVSGRAEMGGG